MYIVPFSDFHIGHKNYQEKYVKDALKFVDANRDRCRIVLLGDLLESATKTSVGKSVYEENMSTDKQLDRCVQLFKPYSDLIDLVIQGNHESRISEMTSIEMMKLFSKQLGIENKYNEYNGIVNFGVGKYNYSAYCWHGAGGGVKEASAYNALLGMRNKAMCNMYFMGHTHKRVDFEKVIQVPSLQNDKTVDLKQLFVNTGTALECAGGYGDMKGYEDIVIGFYAVELFANKRKMIAHKIENLI